MIFEFTKNPAESVLEITFNNFKNQFGEDNVTFKKDEDTFIIFTEKQMFAINDPEYDGWKFVEKSEGFEIIYSEFIPDEVRQAFE